MSEVERQCLDHYLESLKRKTDPKVEEDDSFAQFCISQILKGKDIGPDERDAILRQLTTSVPTGRTTCP